MANYVSNVTIPTDDGSTASYDIRELFPHVGNCTVAASAAAKTVTIGNFKLYTGAWVVVKFSNTNSAAVASLTLNVDGTGAKPIKYRNANLSSADLLIANRYTYFVYDGTNYQIVGDFDTNSDTYDRNRYKANIKAGTSALVAGNIIVGKDGVFNHLKSGGSFDISYPILYLNGAVAAGETTNNSYNIINFTITTTQSISLTAYLPVFIKGTLSGKIFTPVSTAPLTQTVPTTDDGYQYMYLGNATSTSAVYLTERHPIYAFKNNAFGEIVHTASNVNGYTVGKSVPSDAVFTDTKVTSSANHYTPATASGQDKSDSATGAAEAWGIDVVKGVTLNTDGKGHVTGISVTSGKIPGNPVPSNNVTGSGTSGYLTKWNGTHTITNGPQLGSSTTTFLRNDGSWATPPGTYSHPTYTERPKDIYKFHVNTLGHVDDATALDKTDVSTLINKLDTGSSTPVDADYYISQYVGGGTTTTSYHRRPMSALWSYINGKISATTSGSGNAVTSVSYSNGVITATKGTTFSTTDENVKATKLAQSTAEAVYYPTLVSGAGTAGVSIFDSAKINHTPGTTSAVGNTRLILGNATASGTANNEEGLLKLYSPGTSYHTLKGASTSSVVEHTLPTTGGTILNSGTTSFTQTLSSGTKIGTIKINGTSTDLYCQTNTNTDTKVTQSETTTTNYRPIVFGATNSTDTSTLAATITDQAYVSTLLYAQPQNGILYANRMYLKNPGSKGQLNLLTSKYNVMLRNDDSNTYFLVTAQNDPTGTWTSARPLTINNSTGVCNINGNAATATSATKATQDGDGNTISSTYLKLSGGTMTGTLTAKASQYADEYGGALNMNNSNIYGVNSIYTADASDNAAEGIHFYRDSTHVDTLWMNGGSLLFVPNRELGTSTTVANSQKVARFTANPTTGEVVITDGTTGGVKSSGYTIATSVPSGAVFTDTKNTAGSTDTSSKIYLIGATSQAANPQTYSDNEVYTTSGVLTTKSVQVGGGSCTMQYNSTTQSLDFVFV